ncbi:unnamed protein product, partial [Sphagnum troendelagicum]
SSNFECNICLEMACEPVVTTCGHLFCWPCLHNCLQPNSPHQECPVCKGAIAPSVLTPIYGRGSESSTKISTSEAAASSIPLRPQAHRVESRRQRAERYVGERDRARWVRMNELAAFHMRLERTWQSREAARSVEAEQIRHVQMRHMRETPIRVAHEQNESTFHWTGVRARPVQRNNITNSYNVLFQQQPVQSQPVEVVPSFAGGDRSTGSPPVHEHAIEIRPSISGTPASSASVDALATAQVVPRQVGAREVLMRERQRQYQDNVSALLESRQDHSETFVDDGAAASEVGDMRLHGRKWRRLD